MSDSIVNRAGGNATVYDIVVGMNLATGKPAVGSITAHGAPVFTGNSEIVIRLFWDQVGGGIFTTQADTADVAQAVEPFVSQLSGLSHPLAELPIHLIGHSRGGSVMSELARILGQKGIWVHQLTLLDPHPVRPIDIYPTGNDAEVRVWETVLFADNYYEDHLETFPNGESANGAYNENLKNRLPGGYGDGSGPANHSDVHLWYYGTVNTGPGAWNGDVTITGTMRDTWYLPNQYAGQFAGFYRSRLGGGGTALDGFIAGYNDGSHNLVPDTRYNVTRNASEWPSLISLLNNASGSVQAGNTFPVEYIFQSYGSSSVTLLYLDPDQNPYNGNQTTLTLSPDPNPQSATTRTTRIVDANATVPISTPPGFYWLYGMITNPYGTRYLYALTQVRVIAAGTTAAPAITSVSPSTLPTSASQQPIKIFGSGFTASSTLLFNGSIASDSARLTVVNANEIDYNIIVASAGNWNVKVINGAQQSNLGYFSVVNPPPNTGSLTMNLSPAGAVSAGAQWRVDGGAYRNTGDTATGLTPGSHTVSFKSVSGYTTPADKSVSISSGANTADSGTYTVITPSSYTLTINSDHGQVYRNPNKSTFSPGESVRLSANNDPGWHFDQWSGDASGSTSPIDVVMDRDKTVTANWASGDASLVTITMTLQPAGAVAAGARWRIDGGSWQNSGEPLTGQFLGDHYLEFADTPGWFRPAAFSAAFVRGATNLTGIYTQDATPGTLVVTLTPSDAVTAGAKWRVNGGAQQNSGASVSLAPGSGYNVTFDSASGWTAPSSQPVTIQPSQAALATGNYTPSAGQPVIMSVSPPIGPLAGGTALTIAGANFVAPATVLIGGQPATNVTLLSASHIACLTPSNSVYGSVPVVVQTAGGSATNLNGFTYGVTPGSNLELVSSAGGRIDAVAVNGNYAYVGEGCSFMVMDVSDPSSPFPVGRRPLPGVVGDIAVFTQSGRTYACVAARDSGLFILDVTNPVEPALKGFYKTPGFCYGVAVLGGFAYVADGSGGLEVFDLANPSAPALRSAVPQAGFANEIAVKATPSGVFAYLSTGGGLRIVDVSDPQAPVVRGYVGFGQWTLNIAVTSTRAYLTTQGNSQMADISNPDNPTSLGQFDSGIAYAIAIQGTTLYCAGSAGFRIQDISTGTPQDIGNLSFLVLTSDGFNMVIANNHAYIAGGEQGLIIVSVSTPSTPVRNGSYTVGLGSYPGVAVDGQYAYTACANGGANIFDVSNPALPQDVKQLPASGAQKVIVNNGRAYVLDYYGKIGIYDVSTPSSATLLGTIPTSLIFSWAMSYYGGYLLVSGQDAANYRPEIAVMNVSTPSSPSVYAKLELSSVANPAIAVVNNGVKACVAIGNIGEVRILNVSQANNPTQTGQIQNLGAVASLAMSADGQTLFVGNNGPELCLRVFNISDPSTPTLVSSNYVGGEIRGITLTSGKAYLAAGGPGVILMDVGNPAAPQILRSYDTPGYAQQVALSGDYLYVADSQAGLVVLKLTDIERPEIYITNPTFSPFATNLIGTMNMGGSAADNKGVTRVTWSNSRGGGGDTTGTDNWLVSGIALQPGTNVLVATAFDQTGNSSNDTLTVIYQTPKQSQTITFPALTNKTFGDAPITLAAAANSGLAVSFSVLSGSATLSNNVLAITGAGAVTVRASQSGNDSFNAAPDVTNSFNVAKADQAITFALLPDKSVGDVPFAVNATASSGLPVTFSIVSGTATVNSNVVTLTGAGAVTVRASQSGNTNFNAALDVERSFIVAKRPQFITFGALSRQVFGDAPFALSATASSGLPVGFSVLSGPAIVSGNILTVTGAGLVVLRASQSGDATYAPAPNADQVLIVAPGNNIITDFQRLANGMFTFRFYGEPGTNYVVQGSTNLVNWLSLATNQVSGLGYLEFTDTSATNYSKRFYRMAPLSALIPSGPVLTLMLVGNNVVVSWSTNDFGFTLESATNLPPTIWTSNSISPAVVSGRYTITNPISGQKKSYRLMK